MLNGLGEFTNDPFYWRFVKKIKLSLLNGVYMF